MPNGEEILASLEDIQAHLPDRIVVADEDNTVLIQISVARIIRGYLARSNAIDNSVLLSWTDPAGTPEIIREIAGMLIASQLFFNKIAESSTEIDDDNFAQRMYDKAIAMLEAIVLGTLIIVDVVIDEGTSMNDLNFFPIDDTDRAFTLGMEL